MLEQYHIKARLKAMSIHLVISTVIFILTALLLIYTYFPSIHFTINGGLQGLTLMFWIDIVLGPLLTFLVFNPTKPKREKITDCLVIALVQFMALVYGFYHVYEQRPKFLLLRTAGIVETVTEKQFNGDLKKVDLTQFKQLTQIPFVAFDADVKENQGLVSPKQQIEGVIRMQKTVLKSLDETQLSQWNELKSQYKEPIYLLQLVGTYKTEYIVVNEDFDMVASLGRKDTL